MLLDPGYSDVCTLLPIPGKPFGYISEKALKDGETKLLRGAKIDSARRVRAY